jgi:glycerophosphoryl diester phosphodiesterase
MKIIGHRGLLKSGIDENSLESLKIAMHEGVKIIEIDLHQTKDKVVVVYHDPILIRNGKKYRIRECDYEFLRSIRHMPTLEDALRLCTPKTKLWLDIKVRGMEEEILRLIKKYKAEKNVIISSFHPLVLGWFRKNAPKIDRAAAFVDSKLKAAFWWPWYTFFFPEWAKKLGAKYIDVPRPFATKEFVWECHLNGLKIVSFYYQTKEQIAEAIKNKVDFLELDTVEQERFAKRMKH